MDFVKAILSEPIYLVLFVGVPAIAIFWVISFQRCPKCKRYRALKPTGSVRERGLFRANLAEWKCKYCGCSQWKKHSKE